MCADRSPSEPSTDPLGEAVAADFAVLARALQAEDTVVHTLETMCKLAVHLIDGADHAGITVLRETAFTTTAASDPVSETIDRIQYSTKQGPCLDAIHGQELVDAPDIATDARWPRFARRALAQTKVRSILCFRLFLAEGTLGSLNFYSETPFSFADSARPLGKIFATHAAVALQAARSHDQVDDLHIALASSRRIGIALGILMRGRGITEHAAFDLMRTASQASQRKLRDIADDVALTGDLPPHSSTR